MKKIILASIAVLSRKEQKKLFRLILLHTFVSIADIASLALLLALIHFYTQPATGAPSAFGSALKNVQQIHFLVPLLLFLLLFVLKNLASFFAVKKQYEFIYQVASRISRSNMLGYLNGDYYDYAQINPSVQISRISYQPTEFCTYILAGIQQITTEAILTIAAIIAILLFNAKLFLLLLLILLPPVILSAYFSKKKLNAARSNVKESSEKATQYLHEALSGYIESNVFHKKTFFTNRYADSQQKLSTTLSRLQIVQAFPPRFIEVFAVFGLLILIILNKYSGGASMELVNIGAFMAAAYKIIPGITRIANISAQMRMFEHTINVIEKPGKEKNGQYDINLEEISTILFENVSFNHHKNINLLHFNMAVKKGDFLVISSDSGKGKTTMINLLLGFLKPDKGIIYINGNAALETARKQYWHDISYVKQQTFLIHDTILRNITLEDNNYDAQRLQQSIHMAGLEHFIDSFPEGVEKIISDNGKNISGGQRQRIALARAFYKEASLIILDEPFNELDASSEHVILQHLQSLASGGKIIMLITHNKKSLEFGNKTVSINE